MPNEYESVAKRHAPHSSGHKQRECNDLPCGNCDHALDEHDEDGCCAICGCELFTFPSSLLDDPEQYDDDNA